MISVLDRSPKTTFIQIPIPLLEVSLILGTVYRHATMISSLAQGKEEQKVSAAAVSTCI